MSVEQTNQNSNEPNYLEMSDDDFLKAPTPSNPVSQETTEEEEDLEKEEQSNQENLGKEEDSERTSTASDEEEEEEEEDLPAGTENDAAARRKEGKAESDEGAKGKEAEEGQKTEEGAKNKDSSNTKSTESSTPQDYEKLYKEVMAPFKANGREIQPKSIEDIKQLMQMGANYNKKMQALKPNLKLLKMLENNGLLDESKLSFLIDLDKKNPEAISKLVKDSGVDPMEIDEEKVKSYKSGTYSVNDKEIELEQVLDELESTPTFDRTLTIVSKEWDQASRNVFAQHPQMLKLINNHIQVGVFDLISKEMETERALGRLTGLSDFDAYRQVGDAINARGGFDHLKPQDGQNQGHQTPVTQKTDVPNPKKQEEDKLKDKRRAATLGRTTAPSSNKLSDYNPLAMSDEEFEKMASKKHLM